MNCSKKRPLLTALFCCLLSLSAFAQGINITAKGITVKEAIEQIQKETGYSFLFYSSDVDTSRRVDIKANDATIQQVVAQLFSGQKLTYQIKDKTIIVGQKKQGNATTTKANGQIIDSKTGDPIIGASVTVKDTKFATVSDVDGFFDISMPSSDSELTISYIGYLPQTIKAGTDLKILLVENSEALNEVVVIGYGSVRKVDVAGAVSTASSDVFESRSITDASSALQGAMPGLTVIRNSGNVDDAATLRVRDISSINGGSPLVLIDGAVGDLNLINPADIENISVLKDGSAAIYGSRAADGVILVTTKQSGKNQPVRVDFSANAALVRPALLKRTANLYQHADMVLEITDGSFTPEYTRDELELIRQGSDKVDHHSQNFGRWNGYDKFYKDQNWNDLIIGNGYQQNYNVNITGGGERFNFLVSLGYQRNKGIVKYGKDIDNRYFVRTKAAINLLRNLKYDVNISYEAGSRNYSSGLTEGQNIWELIYKTRTWAPLRTPGGHFYTFEGFDNPAQVLEEGGMAKRTSGNYTFNNQLTWTPISGLNIIGSAVIRKYDFDKSVENKTIYSWNYDDVNHRTARNPNYATRTYDKTLYRNFTLYANYKHTFGTKHTIDAMLGAAHESESFDSFWGQRKNFDQQENMSINLGSSENQETSCSGYAWTINSFFGRVNYTFDNKYIVEGTLRTDGSSRFARHHRWGWFPGVNVAWRISQESFMKNARFINDLKLRGSYGEMGNQSGIGYYDFIPLIQIQQDYYPFGDGQKGIIANASTLTSDNRTWETVKVTNVGVDFSLLNYRLYGSFDYFWKKNDNMLIPITYPSLLGATPPSTNSGKLKVNGWELALGWRSHVGDFKYDISVNLSDSKNEVVDRIGSNLINLGLNSAAQGYPINSFFGYEFDGIIQNEEQLNAYKARFPNGGIPGEISVGDAMYKDLDGDGKLSVLGDGQEGQGDVKYLGDMNPRYNFGVNVKMFYKGFDFSMFIQGTGRRTMFLQGEADKPMSQPWFQSAEYWYGKTWTPDRTDAKYPAITLKGKRSYNYYNSTNTKHNVAYVRMKNMQLGYTLQDSKLAKVGIQKLRVYLSGENLFEIHNTPGGWDPEENGNYWTYPFVRNYSFGVNLVF